MKNDEIASESLGSCLDAMAREDGLTRWIGAGLLAALATFLAWHGLPSRSLVCTERLELRDRQGRLRAAMAVGEVRGTPSLSMYDDRGHELVSLVADRDDPILILTSSPTGLPSLRLQGAGGRGSVTLYADADGSLDLLVDGGGRYGH